MNVILFQTFFTSFLIIIVEKFLCIAFVFYKGKTGKYSLRKAYAKYENIYTQVKQTPDLTRNIENMSDFFLKFL